MTHYPPPKDRATADDQTVSVRATGTPGAVERLIAAIRGMDVEEVTTRGPYQRNGGRVAFYADVRFPAEPTPGRVVFAPGELYLRRVVLDGFTLRVIPRALHDVLCTWRVATPQGTEPEVLGCAGCGLCYPKAEVTSA